MWKYLLIFAAVIILLLAVYVAHQDAGAVHDTTQKVSTPNNGPVAATADSAHPTEDKQDSKLSLPRWYGFFRWPGGTTTWAIILTLIAIVEQTRFVAKAAKAAQESADAVRDSIPHQKTAAEAALSNAAAAKISADIAAGLSVPTLVVHEFRKRDVGVASAEAFFQWPEIKITIKNYGQSPAFLKWWSLCFTCEELADVPIYDGPATGMVLDRIVVQPGETYTLPDLFASYRPSFGPSDVQAIVSREKTFRAYGYICYGDLFGNPLRRFKFCETVLNIFGGQAICDWWEGLAPGAYTGTDQFPIEEQKLKEPSGQNQN